MSVQRRKRIVLLGAMTKMPVGGVVWQNLHYLLGFERLGFETYYVETHGRTPSMLMRTEHDNSSARAAEFLSKLFREYDLADRWAFCALHDDGRCWGMSWERLRRIYSTADLIINLHGTTEPLPPLVADDRLVYLETDPVQLQVELAQHNKATIEFLEPHCAFFSFAENLGKPDCLLPVPREFAFHPTRQPVVLDLWSDPTPAVAVPQLFTTVGNWRQDWRTLSFEGESYSWSKHQQFLRFIDLPSVTNQQFELALSSCAPEDERTLVTAGWKVRPALEVSTDRDAYRSYVVGSRGEFTVAKDQNVRFRSGWFSDRSATYLAAGRPVITQETGFSAILPTGEGLFPFSTVVEAQAAVEKINADYQHASASAAAVAREYFDSAVVLKQLLEHVGVPVQGKRKRKQGVEIDPFPPDLNLVPKSRRPTKLVQATVSEIRDRPPLVLPLPTSDTPETSIVVATRSNLLFLRLCLESVLASNEESLEVIVVDNGSTDNTPDYLMRLSEQCPHVRVIFNGANWGFARACNEGVKLARGENLVLLNDDTIVTSGWLSGLLAYLEDPEVGMVGPTTNRSGDESELPVTYRTWQELQEFARARTGGGFPVQTLTMFCVALKREVFDRIGNLDERFEVGLLEDDDYSMRLRNAGYRLICAEDVFVHHFGETSFGRLVPTGEYGQILAANKERFQEKWGVPWEPYKRRLTPQYTEMRARVRDAVEATVPEQARVLVISKGDEELLHFSRRIGQHFPAAPEGGYAGDHPADGGHAITLLEKLRAEGAGYLVLPETSLWWLDHYTDFGQHLESNYATRFWDPKIGWIVELEPIGQTS